MTQLSSDPLDILIRHNTWANRILLERCRDLASDQFHKDLGIGPGSLHDNLTHIIGAMFRWADRIENRPLRPRIDGRIGRHDVAPLPRRFIDELLTLLDEAHGEWLALLPRLRLRLGEVLEITFTGEPATCRFTVAAAIIHVTNHGMHHRAQCQHMFKQLGISSLPDLDEIDWQHLGEP